MLRSITFLPATEADLDRIDLCQASIDDLVKSDLYDLPAATLKAKQEINHLLKQPSVTCFMCFEEEEEVGHVLAHVTTTELLVISLEVYEEYRGQGYGKSILLAIEQLAVEQDVNRISVSVSPWNSRALKLYKNNGFGELFVRMEKRL